jgi:hypothetical protein
MCVRSIGSVQFKRQLSSKIATMNGKHLGKGECMSLLSLPGL